MMKEWRDIPSDGREHMQNEEAMDIHNNDDGLFSLRTRSGRVPGWCGDLWENGLIYTDTS